MSISLLDMDTQSQVSVRQMIDGLFAEHNVASSSILGWDFYNYSKSCMGLLVLSIRLVHLLMHESSQKRTWYHLAGFAIFAYYIL